MAQTTVYTCDLCKGSKDKNDLAKIEVKVDGLRIKGVDNRYASLKIDICKECLKKKGFVVEPKVDDEENQQTEGRNRVTLEDKLYDILEDMGVVFAE